MTVHENDAKAAAALWPKVQTLCKKETGRDRDNDSRRETERGRELAACGQSINHWGNAGKRFGILRSRISLN